MPKKPKKPQKPYKDFPLFAHPNGQWCKKIRGKPYYFGTWDNPDAALELWLQRKDYLLAGKEPPSPQQGSDVSVLSMCASFLEAKLIQHEAGEIGKRQYLDYVQTCKRLKKFFGSETKVLAITQHDFAVLRRSLDGRSPVSIKNELQRIRTIFKWAFGANIIGKPVDFGPGFNPPSKRHIRRQKQQSESRVFEPSEIRSLLTEANTVLRAMIYLGINCGWGNTDVASVPISAFDLKNRIVDFPRPKTAVERRATLWLETVQAIQAAIEVRPDPLPGCEHLLFVTMFGRQWVRPPATDSVGLQFGRLLRRLKIKRYGINFYSLRHTFRTIAEETLDFPAVDRIMGHETPGMGTVYRGWKKDRREDERLRRVTDHVYAWLDLSKSKELAAN